MPLALVWLAVKNAARPVEPAAFQVEAAARIWH